MKIIQELRQKCKDFSNKIVSVGDFWVYTEKLAEYGKYNKDFWRRIACTYSYQDFLIEFLRAKQER